MTIARPVVRPAHQRAGPPPDPVFPQTPPDSATLDSKLRPTSDDWEKSVFGSRTPTRADFALPLPPGLTSDDEIKLSQPALLDSPPPPSSHVRSHSFSTSDEHTINSHQIEPGTFKVIIERPPQARPKTADTSSFPVLEVPIPHYRLGTPRFSARGTAILRSSVYTSVAATEDCRSSLLTPQRLTPSFLSSRPRSDVYTPNSFNYPTTMDLKPPLPSSEPSSARISKLPIGPQIYDTYTTDPDDRAAVRFSPTGDILAATPSRLVAHITSPSFLDYELLSDFFLTFRSFLASRELVAYLLSRLRWAVDRQDDFGRIVRVRTFVALRHWILNYFVDDFVPKYRLRVYFCELVNELYRDLKAREDGGGGDAKIVGELKKCWRRTCTLYWDNEDSIAQDLADDDLLPGGKPGSQVSDVEHVFTAPVPSTPPRQTTHDSKVESIASNPSDQFASRHMDWAHRSRHTPQNSLSSPYSPSQEYSGVRVPLSPESERSMQVLSCSIPMRGLGRPEPVNDVPLYPHPVPHPITNGSPRSAPSPQRPASTKKPARPSHAHKRSGSFSDALRDNRAPLSLPKYGPSDEDITTITAISKVPGSLVRGGLFQPSSPYIDVKNGGLRHTRSRLELVHQDVLGNEIHMRGPYASNPGMKKLIGSVRRALSSKQPNGSSPQLLGSLHHHHGSHSARSSNPTTMSTVSEGVHKRRQGRPRPQVRIDALASAVGNSFKEAIQEQIKNEQRPSVPPNLSGFEFEFDKRTPESNGELSKDAKSHDLRLHSGITTGSQSILIMDDTGPPPLPLMSGALPISASKPMSRSHESSQLEPAPSTIEESTKSNVSSIQPSDSHQDDFADSSVQRMSRGSLQASIPAQRRSLSTGPERMHSFRRRGSTKTSMARPVSLRRHVSHASGLSRHQKAASIATFQTMSSDNDPFHLDQQPTDASRKPVRQLRRRPGGDLRAVDNVHDLEQGQRPHSTGSVSNRTHSIANSVILRSNRFIEPTPEPVEQVEEEASNEGMTKKPISLVDTHSSQPNLRPSFEAEVAKLAALPDDTDDDGGIEAALMKLEGRYEKKSPDPSNTTPDQSPNVGHRPEVYRPTGAPADSSKVSYAPFEHNSQPASSAEGVHVLHRPLAPPETEDQGMYCLSGEAFNGRVPTVNSAIESEDSYSSIPLLDRGLSEITQSARAPTMETMRSSAKPAPLSPLTREGVKNIAQVTSPDSSLEYVIQTSKDQSQPKTSAPRESFLLDDGEDLSDVESRRDARSEDTSHGVRSFFEDETPHEVSDKEFLPTHPMRHPPTPPLTANRLNEPLPYVDTTVFEKGLPTPGLTPTSRPNGQIFEQASKLMEPAIEPKDLKKEQASIDPPHLPFILAYDSETLAQQFTVIEKDALDEIDWRELIELRWKQSSPKIRDWVHYLRTGEVRGVDVVIARFNLVVKWAVSEVVLTENLEERARCIVKYIHIAAHARRLRNYATMYQITIALLSNDVSRLRKTWSLVPAAELATMRDLETLVQPLKNFHSLRVEMETVTVEDGCIPFIGKMTPPLR